MAKKSAVEKNDYRGTLVKKYENRRNKLKAIIQDKTVSPEERFQAQLKLNELPRNSSSVRLRTRCALSGRPRSVYRKFKLSRIALRELASTGQLPGVVKASW